MHSLLLLSVFGIELAKRTVYGLRIQSESYSPALGYVYNSYLAAACFCLSGGMLIYGTLVYHKKKNISKLFPGKTDMTRIVKVTSIVMIISATLLAATITTVVVTVLNTFATSTGALVSFTIDFLLELTLNMEMMYLMIPRSPPSTPAVVLQQLNPVLSKDLSEKQNNSNENQEKASETQHDMSSVDTSRKNVALECNTPK